ncbi:helix-turn-helix domain-containing protein [Bacillus wiedmannii]|uniref:helix-turn-helix domain-containing protein n=1 Tax=Bacillus wiedmannii TaxID=1890302 RepID=UPI002E22DE21|nr:helix-turn-helix domain-containing protein [Bacillus wiedmannii]
MGRTFNTEEVLKILKDCYITDSVQTLRKWIREGKIIATGSPFKQEGYTIKEEDLKSFIEEERPGFLDILKVYHQINDKIPLGITLIINRSEPKAITLIETPEEEREETALLGNSSNELGTILEMLSELEQQMQELKVIVEERKNKISEDKELEKLVDVKIEEMKNKITNDVMEELNSQVSVVSSTINKEKKLGRHSEKSEEEFVTFLRKECWNPRPELGKLKGDMNKKFKEEAKKCYALFYNEDGLFRDGELFNENEKKLELKIVVNNQEIVIKAENRKELMEQYFELAFLSMMQSGEVNLGNDLFPIWDDEENDGDIEILDLADKIKLDEDKKADVS